ncbi:3'(2'),5'-bisphosphate nucleotidase CysQ [Rarobacter faecitabidus]|uniref:3'(2'),5'-bisphosphate nucleotidase n=1 Tax=Rarobacter faecitabidus TaxID=13243 RepID=A0A542ZUL8_RARFA|nr:3'(2'),5'-bisphosphate nucleotidase CysQ [Rarobacter faecitabidus]TQL64063.1 3'(2'),5'-bisphosphate nucleotidase [Rarobacter faecitabidus]
MNDDHTIAARLAEVAGNVLLDLRRQVDEQIPPGESHDARALRSRADSAAQRALASELSRLAPGDEVLSEEAADSPLRLTSERVWIIDPLDGTREYAERDGSGIWRDDWAVHVALWTRTGGLTAGAVSLPARGQMFHTGQAAPGLGRPGEPLRLAVSRSHPSPLVAAVIRELGAIPVPMGSAGVKAMAVATGLADAYVHAGGQYQWDSAAPVAYARHAGLFTSRIDGTELTYNNVDLSVPDLIICHPEATTRIQTAVVAALVEEGLNS